MKRTIKDLIDDLNGGLGLTLLGTFGLENLDFSEISLEKMEEQMNKRFPFGHQPMATTTFIPFGWYLGECLVRGISGAKWVIGENESSLFKLGIEIPSFEEEGATTVLRPFVRIEKFWYDRTDGLAVFFRTAKMIATIDMEQIVRGGVVDADGWVHFPNGDSMRITKEQTDNQ